ncbi:MAG: hypothetical protein HYU66_27375 [Armatimonadetes bacterium]|nr:hypothetical protein [Armatimonadota bacterium]
MRALDWTRPEVRDHFLALAVELLEGSDLDGLELDWMRFGYHFPVGRELAGGAMLTEWLGEVRRHGNRAAQRLGHPVRLGVRVPSTPETARRLGLDGAAWAKAGLVDLVVPTPFWQTTEFDMPLDVWKRLLEGTGATLAGGLEVRYQSWRGGPAPLVTPEVAAGLATNVLAGGADAVYLFNYFLRGHFGDAWSVEAFDRTIGAMRELDRVAALPRRHGITFRDVRATGAATDDQLAATGTGLTFRVCTGPKPAGRAVEALVQVEGEAAPPALRVNGVDCGAGKPGEAGVFTWALPEQALADGYHVLELTAEKPVRVVRVEVGVS